MHKLTAPLFALALAMPLARAHAAPLSRAEAVVFRASAPDALTKKVCSATKSKLRASASCRDKAAYVKSNELDHDLWRPYLRGLGGAYVGVGSDQGLTFVAWQRAELAWLIDYDPRVVRFNRVTRALVLAAPDIARFRRMWQKQGKRAAVAAIRAACARSASTSAAAACRRQLIGSYLDYRETLRRHYALVARLGRGGRRMHWLHDASDYTFVRRMFREGRVRILGGDLLGPHALLGIGATARRMKVAVRALYLSNAEEFWRYTPRFRRNMRALPMDARSIVLRTRHNKRRAEGGRKFFYVVQSGVDFQRRLAEPRTVGVWSLLGRRLQKRSAPRGVLTLGLATKSR
ncbi:MAG: hypothetical protein KC503_20045 [Myxococcales bacterium]|nr:hypothetical protein [Myxococcales bacterium]